MTARLLSADEAEGVIARMGGLDRIRLEDAQHARDFDALARYVETVGYEEHAKWVAFHRERLVATGPSSDDVTRQLNARGIDPARAVMYCRVPPGVRVILATTS